VRIRTKLLLGFAVLIGVNAATGLYAAIGVGRVSAMTGALYDRPLMAGDFSRSAFEQFMRHDRLAAVRLRSGAPRALAELPQIMTSLVQAVSDDLAIVVERFAGSPGADFIERARDVVKDYADVTQRLGEALAREPEDRAEVRDLTEMRDGLVARTDEIFDLLVEATKEQGLTFKEDAVLLGDSTSQAIEIGAGVTLGLGLLIALMLARGIARPITAITTTMAQLAAGEIEIKVPALGRRDEVGEMAKAVEVFKRTESDRRAMEIQLRHAQKLEALGTLASGIAHEINTPAQYIGDNLRFLLDSFAGIGTVLDAALALRAAVGDDPRMTELAATESGAIAAVDLDFLRDEIPTAIAQSIDGVSRISQIVQAVKEFSHPDTKEVGATDLNHAIGTALTVSRNQWKHVAEVTTDLSPTLPLVLCRAGEINQVLLNLIVNAAHAIEARGADMGRISLSTAQRDDAVEIRIADTGTGIPPSLVDRIFDPFFTTKAPGKGTGQGLAICHTIVVQKHRGSIRVETIPGEGTTFIIRLPLKGVADPLDVPSGSAAIAA
jgi:signal transduction histidine kinase